MTTATRLRNGVARLSFGAMTGVGLLALPITGSQPAMAQSHGPAALTGTVSSTEEGDMEGVVVSAKRPGSTIMVSVGTNAQGQYSFPQDRLEPGAYDITIRAIGYALQPTKATIQSGGPTQLDIELAKAAPDSSCPANVEQRVDAKRAGHAAAENRNAANASIAMACSVRSIPKTMRRTWRSRCSACGRIPPMPLPIFLSSFRTRPRS